MTSAGMMSRCDLVPATWRQGPGDRDEATGIRRRAEGPEVRYERYAVDLQGELLDQKVILSTTELPAAVTFGSHDLTVLAVEVARNETRGFSAYLNINADGEEVRVGFWHPDGGLGEEYNPEKPVR